MKLLVVGGGAREHALVWKLAGERAVSEILCAPGNAGIAKLARTIALDPGDPEPLVALVEREHVDLTIVGPEVPLSRGIANLFASRGRALFGPTREAAEIESSKVFAKEFMARHGVPTARHRACRSMDEALASVHRGDLGWPLVIKADGLAAGKGVVIAPDARAAEGAVRAAMVERRFGEAGARLVIEEHLRGREVSFFVIADGARGLPLGSAEDHKRAFDGDRGPNTGGMGAFAPSPVFDPAIEARVLRDIVEPVLAGLQSEGREFRGFLYAGLILTAEGPKVVEFNARLGDPEAEVVLPMLDEDLWPLVMSAAMGELDARQCRWRPEPHVAVVLASGGYPDRYQTGKPIDGLELAEMMPDVLVFHAGTAAERGSTVTAGGRVLTVVGRASSYGGAIERAYAAARTISFEGMQLRTDIGAKALQEAY